MSTNSARRRYQLRFWPIMAAYVAAVLSVTWLFNNQPPEGPIKFVIASLPALPILGIFFVMARYLIEETDEFLRLRQTIALLVGIGLTLSFCAIWGFLEIYKLVPTIGLFNVVWGYFLTMGIGLAFAKWLYR